MPVPEFTHQGYLPAGRYPATQGEIYRALVASPEFADSSSRPEVWRDWQLACSTLRSAVDVHAAWIGGSFTTTKMDPGDIDVLFIVNRSDRNNRNERHQKVIEAFARRPNGHGLQVDSFVLSWHPYRLADDGTLPPKYAEYSRDRGYWDDWWARARVPDKPDRPDPVRSAFPRRGYLEVRFDDYR